MHVGVEGTTAVVAALSKNTDLELRGGNNTPSVHIKDDGSVGIGTSSPQDRLDVAGNIRMWSTLYAPGSTDNLRVIVGSVSSSGVVISGTGFTASRTSQGHYRIIFTAAFPAPPVVIANVVNPTADDDVTMVNSISSGGFFVNTINLPTSVGYEDLDFSFVVFGAK
jgi:hypothetical protein